MTGLSPRPLHARARRRPQLRHWPAERVSRAGLETISWPMSPFPRQGRPGHFGAAASKAGDAPGEDQRLHQRRRLGTLPPPRRSGTASLNRPEASMTAPASPAVLQRRRRGQRHRPLSRRPLTHPRERQPGPSKARPPHPKTVNASVAASTQVSARAPATLQLSDTSTPRRPIGSEPSPPRPAASVMATTTGAIRASNGGARHAGA